MKAFCEFQSTFYLKNRKRKVFEIFEDLQFTVFSHTIMYESLLIMKYRYDIDAMFFVLSHDIASGSDITPYNKIDKPLVDYRFNHTT